MSSVWLETAVWRIASCPTRPMGARCAGTAGFPSASCSAPRSAMEATAVDFRSIEPGSLHSEIPSLSTSRALPPYADGVVTFYSGGAGSGADRRAQGRVHTPRTGCTGCTWPVFGKGRRRQGCPGRICAVGAGRVWHRSGNATPRAAAIRLRAGRSDVGQGAVFKQEKACDKCGRVPAGTLPRSDRLR